MKLTTILFFVLLGTVCRGQTDSIIYHNWWSDDSVYRFQKYDTIPVIMLCSDSAMKYYTSEYFIADSVALKGSNLYAGKIVKDTLQRFYRNETFTERGYEVGYSDHTVDQHAMDLISTTYLIWHHVAYLDDNRKPITFLVWDSKNIKP